MTFIINELRANIQISLEKFQPF